MSTRPTDWPQRLAEFLRAKEREPFGFGTNDCCLFTCDWLRRLHGVDAAAPFRGYSSALGAARVLEDRGGVLTIAEQVCAENGWVGVPVKLARRGDVVALDMGHGPSLGVCVGAESAFPGEHGIIYRDTLECVRAWRV
jgi:hypothetical protein